MWKDSETNIDLLDFDYLINTLKDIVENDELSPCSIGIYGDWGSGKSSLAQMALNELSKNDQYVCLKFNGWLFEGYEDAKTALIGAILDKIKENKTIKGEAKEILKNLYKNIDFFKIASKGVKYGLDFLTTGGIGTIADLTLQSVLDKAKKATKDTDISEKQIKNSLENVLKSPEIRSNLKSFQKDFKKLLKETKIKKLIVFIDELDRCRHDTILETLEAIRLFLFAHGTSFILGADERQVMYAVRKKFPEIKGNHIDIGKEYLEKMIQYPIKIPQLSNKEVEYYITCLLFKDAFKNNFEQFIEYIKNEKKQDFINFEITYDAIAEKFSDLDSEQLRETISLGKQLSSVLSASLKGNPRHCKRFLNSLSMRIRMASFKGLNLDKKVLAKIMLIEYFKDSFFNRLSDLQILDKGKPEELKLIEEGQWDKVENLKIWKDDEWVKNWISLEPKLSDYDLQPYFYFTRESLHGANIMTSGLSTEASSVLNDLLSESDIKYENAISKSNIVNEFESLEILKHLKEQIEKSSIIDAKLLKSFLDWGGTKQSLHTEVLLVIESIPSKRIKISFIPRIFNFYKTSGNYEKIRELADRWKNENPKIKKAIEEEEK